MPATKTAELMMTAVSPKVQPTKDLNVNESDNLNIFISQMFELKPTISIKPINLIDLDSTESSDNVEFCKEPEPGLVKQDEQTKEDGKVVSSSEVLFIGEYCNSVKKSRIKPCSKKAEIATLRNTIRHSIVSHHHYQKLLFEVKKKYCNHKTILNEKCFSYLENVFQDMFRVEKLYKKNLTLVNANSYKNKSIILFDRPKNFVQLSKILESTKTFDWEVFFRDDKDFSKIQKQKAAQTLQLPSQSRKRPCSSLTYKITCKQLIDHLSQPLGFENHLYSDDEDE